MPKTLNFDRLDKSANDQKRWESREPKTSTTQMSVRMESAVYDRFKATAAAQRYKHGELLEEMLSIYLELKDIGANERRSPEEMWEIIKQRQPVKEPS